MNNVKVFGRRGSRFKNTINGWMGNKLIATSHLAVNYGLQGENLSDFVRRNPGVAHMPVLNFKQSGNKYDQVKAVERIGEAVPDSYRTPEDMGENDLDWIVKPYYSLGGRDIAPYEGGLIADHLYLQERIRKRRYEIRVHAFAWMDPKDWIFQKRVHEDGEEALAWNFHNGGKFITIEDPSDPIHNRIRESVKKIMKELGYHFGGVDFIVQNPGERGAQLPHYFIEWNLAPGWSLERTEEKYKIAFDALKDISMDTVNAMVDGIYPWELEQEEDEAHAYARNLMDEMEEEMGEEMAEDIDLILPHQQIHIQIPEPEPVRDWVPPAMGDVAPAVEAVDMVFCPACGNNVERLVLGLVQTYCIRCGQKVRD